MTLEGMDADAVTKIASQLQIRSDEIGEIVHHIDGIVNRLEGSWNGHDAAEFAGWWRQQHRASLVEAQNAVTGLHTAALRNISQQESASGSGGESGQTGAQIWSKLTGISLPIELGGLYSLGHGLSDKYGWAVGPFLGLNKRLDRYMKFDQFANFGMDVATGKGFDAFNQAADTAPGFILKKFPTPVTGLLEINDRLWQGVSNAAHNINWDYTMHNLNQLNPLDPSSGWWAPGGMSSVLQDERHGLGTVFGNIGKDLYGATIGWLHR